MGVTVLIVDDEDKLRKLLSRIISLEDYKVVDAASLSAARTVLERGGIDILLCDVKLPDGNGVDFTKEVKDKYPHVQVILLTAFGNIPDGVKAVKNGAFDYIVKGDDNDKIVPLLSQAAEIVAQNKRQDVWREPNTAKGFRQIIGDSKPIQDAITLAQKVAPTGATVLLTGETGTGKEVFAQAIHNASARSNAPFVALNCSSLSKELLESTLFGHKAGAFTGAIKDKKGLIEEAMGGTLFLDEIGELPADLQPKLLRALEDGSYYAVGDTKPRKADVRVISATNRAVQEQIASGHFRADLYYRIATFVITLPALRERPTDILLLAAHFLASAAQKNGKRIKKMSREVEAALRQHDWKGNIRELKHALERAVILEDGDTLTIESLPLELRAGDTGTNSLELAAVERAHICKVLEVTGGNKAEAARLLNIGVATLYRKIDEYGLKEQIAK